MADQLCTSSDLQHALGLDAVDATRAAVCIEAATAVVQAAAGGQRIVQVVGDTTTIDGATGRWLNLPQIPVTAVSAVALDGTTLTVGVAGDAVTTYRLRGNRLWRGAGWQTYVGEPSSITITYTHGYADGDQRLQLARSATLGLAKLAYSNPTGASQVAIDDYRAAYDAAQAAMEASPALRAQLRRQYGRRAALVSIG